MGRIISDVERLLTAAEDSRNGHHNRAVRTYQGMANEIRNPEEKRRLWDMATSNRNKANGY